MIPITLNPGIKFTKIKPYQHRQKEYHSTGYNGHLAEGGQVHIRKGYYTMIKVSRAWRIGFKNVSNTAVDIMTHFSVHRTPVILMLLFLSLVPFTSHSLEMKITITVMGLAYLYWVWKKRHSIKDFLLASATPGLK